MGGDEGVEFAGDCWVDLIIDFRWGIGRSEGYRRTVDVSTKIFALVGGLAYI